MFERFKALDSFLEDELGELKESRVAVVGLGATGSVIAEHLARHGVNLVLLDRDYLEEKDLYTSNLYTREQVEKSLPKAVAAGQKLSDFTEIETEVEHLRPGNLEMIKRVDLVMDGTDNMETRQLINDFSKKESMPWIYTAAIAEKGYSMLFDSKCFNCLFEEISAGQLETCETAGIMRETAAMAASRSAWKAVKYLAGKETDERLEVFPGESHEVEKPGCEVCRQEKFPHMENSRSASQMCGETKFQLEIDTSPETFSRLREQGNIIADNDHLTRVSIDGREIVVFRSGRTIVEAGDRKEAHSFLAEKVGI